MMEWDDKTIMLYDRVVLTDGKRGEILAIGKQINPNVKNTAADRSTIWIRIALDNGKDKKDKGKPTVLFVQPSALSKTRKQTKNTNFSREWKVNDRVFVKSIHSKGWVQSIALKKKKPFYRIELAKNTFDGSHFFTAKAVDLQRRVPDEKLTQTNIEIIVNRLLSQSFVAHATDTDITERKEKEKIDKCAIVTPTPLLNPAFDCNSKLHFIPSVIALEIVKFCPSKDGTLVVDAHKVLADKGKDEYYEFDSVVIEQHARLVGTHLKIKCFGDFYLGESADIDVSGKGPPNYGSDSGSNGNGLGGGKDVDITDYDADTDEKEKNVLCSDALHAIYRLASAGGGGYGTKGCDGISQTYFYFRKYRDPNDRRHKRMIEFSEKNKVPRQGAGGCVYGDEKLTTLHFGSAGGNSSSGQIGDSGGGIVEIICYGEVLMDWHSTISCDGNGVIEGASYKGGGSGGSVYIECEKFVNFGRITARGGQGGLGGNGGDGRIALKIGRHWKGDNLKCVSADRIRNPLAAEDIKAKGYYVGDCNPVPCVF